MKQGELQKLKSKVFDLENFFSLSYEQITRHFLNEFSQESVWKRSPSDLRSLYLEKFDWIEDRDVPESTQEFFAYICETTLGIIKEPSQVFIYEYEEIIKDLDRIARNKSALAEKIKNLSGFEKVEDFTYKKRLYEYYISKNEAAEKEVTLFLRHKLKPWVLTKVKKRRFGSPLVDLFAGHPYHFRRAYTFFDIDGFSEIANKFSDMEYSKYHSLEKLYATDKQQYLIQAQSEYSSEYVIGNIRNRIANNHRIFERKNIIDSTLDFYSTNKELFCNLVPQQIEGLLYDYSLELGIEENSLSNSTLNEKVALIGNKLDFFYEQEYYLFHFPVIRNKVAHGKLIKEDLDLLSYNLLLDLNHITSFLESKDLIINKAIACIKKIDQNSVSIFDSLRYALYFNVHVPEFYGLTKKIEAIRAASLVELVWEGKLDKIVGGENDTINAGILKISKELSGKFNDREFKLVLKNVQSTYEFDETKFLESISNFESAQASVHKGTSDGQSE